MLNLILFIIVCRDSHLDLFIVTVQLRDRRQILLQMLSQLINFIFPEILRKQ